MLGARAPERTGVVVEAFEYVAASPDAALLRVFAAFPSRRPPELSAPRLVVDAGARSLRAPALPDPAGWILRPRDGRVHWRLGFVVPLNVARDGAVAYALSAAPGTLIALPAPSELLLAEPSVLEAVTRRSVRPLAALGVGLAIVTMSPVSLAFAPASRAAGDACSPSGTLPDGAPCRAPAADTGGGSSAAGESGAGAGGGSAAESAAPPVSQTPPPPAAASSPSTAPAMSSTAPSAPSTSGDARPAPAHQAPAHTAPARGPQKPVVGHEHPAHPSRPGTPRLRPVVKPQDKKPRARRRAARRLPGTPATRPATAGGTGAVAPVPFASSGSFTAPLGVPNFFIQKFRIPPFLLPIYQAAGTEYGVPWQVLAAINEIETDYGRNLNVSSAGAQGWMQFMPESWRTYGVDANGDGKKDPYNPVDAIFAAGRYLRAAGAEKNINKAIFAYNHADWYVQSVLLRAKLIGAMPADLVGSLTGLTEGHFPVAGASAYPGAVSLSGRSRLARAATATGRAAPRSIDIYSVPGAPVVAVNDGVIKQVGRDFLVLQDVHGNTYTYTNLGSVARTYPALASRGGSSASGTDHEAPPGDPRPAVPASAGLQRRSPAGRGTRPHARYGTPRVRSTAPPRKERLFAHPSRPAAAAAGGARQLADTGAAVPAGYDIQAHFSVPVKLPARDTVIKAVKPGARVIGGTILGRVGGLGAGYVASMKFAIRPAGRGTPQIDPKPILDGWRLLAATDIFRKQRAGAAVVAGHPSIGQMLLMSKEALGQRVLADRRIQIYECGREDIRAGIIDRRVLALLEFLADSNLKPYVSTLKCGHSYYVAGGGSVSEHTYGDAADIAMINGVPMAGHQGPGSITDTTVRRILTLQGGMQPNQVITLMDYPGVPYAWAQGDHADHIHVGFAPGPGATTAGASTLKPRQWTKLMARLDTIQNPGVPASR